MYSAVDGGESKRCYRISVYWVLLGFTGFYWVLRGGKLDFTGFYRGLTGFYWILLGFTGYH